MIDRETVIKVLHSGLPVPAFLRPMIRALYLCGVAVAEFLRFLYAMLIVKPVVRSIADVGPGLRIERIPYIRGRGRISIGSGAQISGKVGVSFSRRAGIVPELRIGAGTFIGHQCAFSLARAVTIGDNCLIATGVRIQDNDGHPIDPTQRLEKKGIAPENAQRVLIEDNVWIAPRATILKGVTIGSNSVVGTGSVVTADVPPNTLVAGTPAKPVKSFSGTHSGDDVA